MRSVCSASGGLGCLLPAALCLLVFLNLVGCNHGRQLQGHLYQRELRLQEDEIYRLEDHVEEYQAIIRGYRCEAGNLRRELADAHSQSQVISPIENPRLQLTSACDIDIKPFKAPKTESSPNPAPYADSLTKVGDQKFRPAPDVTDYPVYEEKQLRYDLPLSHQPLEQLTANTQATLPKNRDQLERRPAMSNELPRLEEGQELASYKEGATRITTGHARFNDVNGFFWQAPTFCHCSHCQ